MTGNNRDFLEDMLGLDDLFKSGIDISEYFYMKNLQNRKIYLDVGISQETVSGPVMHIHQINEDDRGKPVEERKPIILYISSYGGDVDAGFSLIDAIENSITPVYTINTGTMYSMGFLIGLAGHKRFATKNSKFLMHDGSNFVYNSGAKVQDQMEFNRRFEDRTKQYVLERTKITEEEYNSKFRVEWYMFADEAKEKGCVDQIIGVDCTMDEIR